MQEHHWNHIQIKRDLRDWLACREVIIRLLFHIPWICLSTFFFQKKIKTSKNHFQICLTNPTRNPKSYRNRKLYYEKFWHGHGKRKYYIFKDVQVFFLNKKYSSTIFRKHLRFLQKSFNTISSKLAKFWKHFVNPIFSNFNDLLHVW